MCLMDKETVTLLQVGHTQAACVSSLHTNFNPDEGDAFYSCFKSETVSRTSSRPGQVCSSRYHGDGARLKEGHRCVAERSTELTNTLICLQWGSSLNTHRLLLPFCREAATFVLNRFILYSFSPTESYQTKTTLDQLYCLCAHCFLQ